MMPASPSPNHPGTTEPTFTCRVGWGVEINKDTQGPRARRAGFSAVGRGDYAPRKGAPRGVPAACVGGGCRSGPSARGAAGEETASPRQHDAQSASTRPALPGFEVASFVCSPWPRQRQPPPPRSPPPPPRSPHQSLPHPLRSPAEAAVASVAEGPAPLWPRPTQRASRQQKP